MTGEVAQQPAEIAATDLPSHPKPLHHPVADRIRESGLEAVQALLEAARGLVLDREDLEGLTKRLRSALGEACDGFRERHACSNRAGQVVDSVRPYLSQLMLTSARSPGHHRHREVRNHRRERDSYWERS